ncbi:MAG: hypothetical protein OXT65_00615 [Alphaproteobacteria bacterium]|nr:hypothetical protein [Alphaproteobacteria bacterium]
MEEKTTELEGAKGKADVEVAKDVAEQQGEAPSSKKKYMSWLVMPLAGVLALGAGAFGVITQHRSQGIKKIVADNVVNSAYGVNTFGKRAPWIVDDTDPISSFIGSTRTYSFKEFGRNELKRAFVTVSSTDEVSGTCKGENVDAYAVKFGRMNSDGQAYEGQKGYTIRCVEKTGPNTVRVR